MKFGVGFNPNFFKNLDDKAAFAKGYGIINRIVENAKALDCTGSLVQMHQDWLGMPNNQVKMITAFPDAGTRHCIQFPSY